MELRGVNWTQRYLHAFISVNILMEVMTLKIIKWLSIERSKKRLPTDVQRGYQSLKLCSK